MIDGQGLGIIKRPKTVFIDRDGVINRDSPCYIKRLDEFEFIPGSVEALCRLSVHGFSIIVITNQSVIGRKMTSPSELDLIFETMKQTVASHGGHITDIFFCPHTPEDNCQCRKPATGMIMAAKDKHHIDLSDACMIGDSVKDILCARNAGLGSAILVKTGNGIRAKEILESLEIYPDYVADDLLDAANRIIETDFFIARHA